MTIDERLASTNFPLPAIRQVNQAKHPTAIGLGLGELRNFKADNQIIDALAKSLFTDGVFYSANAGLPQLRQAIAGACKIADGYNYCADNVVVTIGVQNALYATLQALKTMGAQRVLIPQIYFGIYKNIPQQLGYNVLTYKLTSNYGVDINELEQLLEPNDIVIINSPSNPTGRVFSFNEQAALASVFNKKLTNGYVISDEIYSKLVYDGIYCGTFSAFFNRTIVIDGVSKSGAAAGLRVGWAVTSNAKLASAIAWVNALIISCPPTANQYAALPVVEGKTCNTIDNYNKTLLQNRNIATKILDNNDIEYVKPTGSFYLFANVSKYTGTHTKNFCINTAKKNDGVVVIPGEAFNAPGFVRISLATNSTEQGVTRLVNFLKAN